jgi:integrase/recombinase XerD
VFREEPMEPIRRKSRSWSLIEKPGESLPAGDVDALIKGFSDFLLAYRKSRKTHKEYISDVKAWADWWKKDPELFGPKDYDAWTLYQLEEGYAAVSVRRHQASIRKFFKYLIRRGQAHEDPSFGSEPVNVPKRIPQWLTEEEVQEMIRRSYSIRGRAMLHLLYSCGLRNAEMRGVLRHNVTPEYVRIIGKRDKERIVPMVAPEAWKAIEAYLAVRPQIQSPLLFVTCSGNMLGDPQVWLLIKNAAIRAGIEKHVTPHVLRHSIATHLLNRGMDIRFVQEFLGHDNISTTQRYTHVAKAVLTEKMALHHPGAIDPTGGISNG